MSDRERPDHDRDREEEREDDVPEPEAEVSPAEEARAESFASLVDGLVAGDPLPPAMDSEDRALLEAATVVVASTRELGLDDERKHAVIDEALERAVLGRRRPSSSAQVQAVSEREEPRARPLEEAGADVASLAERRRGRALRLLPWAVASVAAAAAIFLFVTRPQVPAPQAARPAPPRLSDVQRSRPADPLVGMIQKEEAARAGDRLDTIFADRMAGYRSLYFRRKLGGSR